MDLYSLLTGANVDADAADPKALAQTLRGQQALGTLALLSGSKKLQPFAQAQIEQAGEGKKLLAALAERRAAAQAKSLAEKEELRRWEENQGRLLDANRETKRYHDWAMANPATQAIAGPGNVIYRVPTKGGGGAVPVSIEGEGAAVPAAAPRAPGAEVAPTGRAPSQLLKRDTPLDTGTRDKLADLTTEIGNLERLGQTLKDDYSGAGVVGRAKTWFGQKAEGLAPEGIQQNAAWWADFNRLVDLPARNKVFGASLSANELASWEAAKNIKPGSDPALVRAKAAELETLARSKLGTILEQEKVRGTNPEELQVFERRTAERRGAKKAVTGYAYSPGRKQRMPIHEDGTSGPVEDNPGG